MVHSLNSFGRLQPLYQMLCKRQALRQIEDKGYAMPYVADPRRLYKTGVNFNSNRCCIEEWKIVEG